MRFLTSYWNGKEPLYKAFWIFGVFIPVMWQIFNPFLLDLLSPEIAGLKEASEIPLSSVLQAMSFWINTLMVISTIYFIWTAISIFRCSKNTSKKIWGILAKAFVIAYLAFMLFAMYMAFSFVQMLASDEYSSFGYSEEYSPSPVRDSSKEVRRASRITPSNGEVVLYVDNIDKCKDRIEVFIQRSEVMANGHDIICREDKLFGELVMTPPIPGHKPANTR